MMLSNEEKDALRFEFEQLQAQKANPAVKWTPGKQKHLDRLEKAVNAFNQSSEQLSFEVCYDNQ